MSYPSKSPRVALYPLNDLEGLSGLHFEKKNDNGELVFWSHTDRGPNAAEIIDPKWGQKRPFLMPDFRPYWVQFSVNPKTRQVKILKKIELSLTGLPNTMADELPVTPSGKFLKRDLMGVDPEAICFDGKHVWMGEEYRPSILKFDLEGKLLKRFVPENSFTNEEMARSGLTGIVSQILPKELKNRRMNRGFEGLACNDKKVYPILQSPLPGANHEVILLEFDSRDEKVSQVYFYPLELKADKIGDLTLLGDKFFVIEQNGSVGPESLHQVFAFRLPQSTDKRIQKQLTIDLVKAGYHFADKVEGLTVTKENLIIVNDNDFGIEGDQVNLLRKTVIGIIEL